MKYPYCDGEMEEGALISRMVPQWLKKDEKKGNLRTAKNNFRIMNYLHTAALNVNNYF